MIYTSTSDALAISTNGSTNPANCIHRTLYVSHDCVCIVYCGVHERMCAFVRVRACVYPPTAPPTQQTAHVTHYVNRVILCVLCIVACVCVCVRLCVCICVYLATDICVNINTYVPWASALVPNQKKYVSVYIYLCT